MDYGDAITYLYALQKHGIKLGLDNTLRLLSLIDTPQNSFQSIHIAGTNGKGSTSAIIASILRAAGLRVGLFTSPHLVSFTERIRVNGDEIKEKEVIELTEEIRSCIEKAQKSGAGFREFQEASHVSRLTSHAFSPTFFEFVTAMAFLYFRRKGVDWAVVETGMGGRLDATNVLVPSVSVITKISLDHREFLGGTLGEIAGEKAGIIKKGIPVVSSMQEPDAMTVIAEKATKEESALFVCGRDFVSRLAQGDIHGITFSYEGMERLEGLRVPLCGAHQMENASVAVKAAELIGEKVPIPEDSIRNGLARTTWPGRLELMPMDTLSYDILIDGAHNPSASRTLAEALERYFVPSYGRIIMVLGIMSDKDIKGIMKPLLPLASEVILTTPGYERAATPLKLLETASALGFYRVRTAPSLEEALDMAKEAAAQLPVDAGPQRSLIVITGSFYTIGEAKTILGSKGVLTRLRE